MSENEDLQFLPGMEYHLDELPESDMTRSGSLERVGDGKLGGRYGDQYVTFELASVRVTDVRSVQEVTDSVSE